MNYPNYTIKPLPTCSGKENDTWAIVTVTTKGVQKSIQVKEICGSDLSIDIYTLEKYRVEGVYSASQDLKGLISEVYNKYKTILFIMASGIVVRMIAPLIQSKLVDPAVLVMDDQGEHIISLLSGHIGGGNDKAKRLAKMIGAKPIITTASDVNETIAVDTFAGKHQLRLHDFNAAKDITALILNGKKVCIMNEDNIKIIGDCLCDNVIVDQIANIEKYEAAIIISSKNNIEAQIPMVQLIPQNIILGIGCRKGIKAQDIIAFIQVTMKELNISIHSIKALSTVDVKEYEQGIIETKEILGIDIDIISREEIAQVQDQFFQSPFVMKTIGVANVSEPCGYITSKGGICILGRTASNGITLSVWKENEEVIK